MEYKRDCPECGKELHYTDRSNYARAIKRNSVCVNCKKMPDSLKKKLSKRWKGKKNPDYKRRENPPKNYSRDCPNGCGNIMTYVRYGKYKEAVKKGTRCRSCIMKDRIKNKGSAYILSQEQINKMAATKAGYDSFDEYMKKLPEFKKYKRKVMSITYKQPLKTLKDYDKKGKMGVEGAYNIDHIYSIHKGFINGIEPKIIGNIKNLKMIPWLENIQKHKN